MKIGIMGYGNLGKGIECAIKQNPDMELAIENLTSGEGMFQKNISV